jgi:dienelactone hydrolase
MPTAPYGSWPSPISPDDLARGGLRLPGGVVDHGVRYWTEGHPEQGGRVGLWREDPDGTRTELTPQGCVRNGVNSYGGGDFAAAGGLVAYTSWPDGGVHLLEEGRDVELAPGGAFRYAALSLAPRERLLLAVREDHSDPDGPETTTVVALDLDRPDPAGGRVLAAGADFYAHPSLSPDGLLAWCEWDQPAMPWDEARIVVAPLAGPTARRVVGGPGVSALYPAWTPGGALLFLADSSGFWNFHRWDGGASRPLHAEPYDFCGPLWTMAPVPYTVIDEHRIGCCAVVDGLARLGVLDCGEDPARLRPLPLDAVTAQLGGRGARCLAVLGFADRPAALVELDWETGGTRELRSVAEPPADPGLVSRARPLEWQGEAGPVHAWYYPPASPGWHAPAGELPPVQVWSHGGPTAFSGPDYSLAVQFWTSRGIGIVDVNYSGSTGYGRAYRERLRGRWGVLDVADCVGAAEALVAAGLADPGRLSIRGSSAGGFTTLAALVGTDTFAAGISLYGIGDLQALTGGTHKFEARYLDGLVAPWPEGRAVYVERSPIHHLDRLGCPMLLLQGTEDEVVPPAQATSIAEALAAKGLPVRLRMFEGEGHGFRRADSIVAVAQESLAFLAEVHGFRA